MSTGAIVLIVLAVVVLGGGLYIQLRQHKRKAITLSGLAARRGWRYVVSDRSLVDRFQGAPFGTGHARQARYVLTGQHRGRQLVAFEYNYDEQGGPGSSGGIVNVRFTVVALATPKVLDQQLAARLLGDERPLRIPMRFEGSGLLGWRRGKIEAETVTWMLDYVCDVLDRVPGFVWRP